MDKRIVKLLMVLVFALFPVYSFAQTRHLPQPSDPTERGAWELTHYVFEVRILPDLNSSCTSVKAFQGTLEAMLGPLRDLSPVSHQDWITAQKVLRGVLQAVGEVYEKCTVLRQSY